jgi:serine/threonine-protein kinase RsbT
MITLKYNIEGKNFSKAGYASSQVKKTLKQLSVDPGLIKNIVVALYESEVNIVAHANKGVIEVSISPESVDMIVSDEGPGIENIELAMKEGYSTASAEVRQMGFGAGMGLPNIKRNVDRLTIDSVVGSGTTLKMNKMLNNANG